MEKPTRKLIRLQEYDYSTPNAYFITICTENRQYLFWKTEIPVGTVIDRPQVVPLSRYGTIVKNAIEAIPEHYPDVTVDNYVIMPNHVHLLLQIHGSILAAKGGRSMNAPTGQAPTISRIIKNTKAAVSKQTGKSIWQKSFYDHVIRSDADYAQAWEYIDGNPPKWVKDELFIK